MKKLIVAMLTVLLTGCYPRIEAESVKAISESCKAIGKGMKLTVISNQVTAECI